jgi:folate-dependent phosphoribosylglycinamide formyltransferase PurN
MKLKPLYNPALGQMQVAGFMSGSGSNLVKIIEHEKKLEQKHGASVYHVAVIFTNNAESNAVKIGKEHDVPVIVRDVKSYYAAYNRPLKDMNIRQLYDNETRLALSPFTINVIAYAGYMLTATETLVKNFLGVNVHPADLSILTEDGKRKYTGAHAVRDAIINQEEYLRSTTHIIEEQVDGGRILMISNPVKVEFDPELKVDDTLYHMLTAEKNQEKLKKQGDWLIFPLTLECMARGMFAQDESGLLYANGIPIPQGVRYAEMPY